MQMGRQNRSGNLIILKERLLQRERERERKENKTTTTTKRGKRKENNNNNNNKKKKNNNNKNVKNKMGNRRAIDVHCWQGFSAVLRPVKNGGSAPFDSNVRAPLSVRLSFGEYPLVGI